MVLVEMVFYCIGSRSKLVKWRKCWVTQVYEPLHFIGDYKPNPFIFGPNNTQYLSTYGNNMIYFIGYITFIVTLGINYIFGINLSLKVDIPI